MSSTPELIDAHHVVVGVDGSEGSFEALIWAARHARRTGLPLKVVTVTEIPAVYTAAGVPALPPGSTFEDLVEHGEDVKARAIDDAKELEPTIDVKGVAVVGTPVTALTEAADPGDVLVVSATSQSGRLNDVLGSVATGVAHRAHGPTVVVHGPVPHDAPLQQIVVGIDGWDESRLALDWALALAEETGSSIDLVHGWEYPYRPKDAVFGSPRVEIQRDARGLVERVLTSLSPEQRQLVRNVHVIEGAPSDVLIDGSKDADLLVVGSRGRGGVRSLLLGSVSRKAVQHAACPVAVIPAWRHWRAT